MKKVSVLVAVLVVGLAFVANAAETKTTTKVTGDTTKTVVKGPQGKVVETVVDKKGETTTKTVAKGKKGEVKEKVVQKPGETTATTEIKGKNIDVKRTVTETPEKVAGTTAVKVKNGAIKDLNIDWSYEKRESDYVLNYTVNDRGDQDLVKELGLTPEQALALTPGAHQIVSTSPFTAIEAQNDFRALIAKDLKQSVSKKTK